MNELFENLKKINLEERESYDRGQGLEPLLQEFVYDVSSLPEEARVNRIRSISDYYKEVCARSGRANIAYDETRKWAMKTYVQHHIRKIRREYGLEESSKLSHYGFHWTDEEGMTGIIDHQNWEAGYVTTNPQYRFDNGLRKFGIVIDLTKIPKDKMSAPEKSVPWEENELSIGTDVSLDLNGPFVGLVARTLPDAKKIQDIMWLTFDDKDMSNYFDIYLLRGNRLTKFNNPKYGPNALDLKEATHQNPFKFQDSHQELLIHSEWHVLCFRYVLEGTGDVFRELSKDFNDKSYIMEKIRRLDEYLSDYATGRMHPDDSMDTSRVQDKEKLSQLLALWEEQPTNTEEQAIARLLNIELIKGNLGKVKSLVRVIKGLQYHGTQLKLAGSILEKVRNKRLGHCYDLSGRYVMDHSDAVLVHGTVTRSDGYTIKHAWVESIDTASGYKTRMVYDPVLDLSLPWDVYERMFRAKEEQRYTHDELMHTVAKQKHWGPRESIHESAIDFPSEGLSKDIWDVKGDKYTLKEKIKEQVIKYVKSYPEQDLLLVTKEVHFCGSLATNTYTEFSDFDIHLVIDKSKVKGSAKLKELVSKINDWSAANPTEIAGYPAQLYAQLNEAQDYVGDSIYNLLTDTWVKGPKIHRLTFDPYKFYASILKEVEDKAKECDVKLGELGRNVIDYQSIKYAYDKLPGERKKELKKVLRSKLKEIESIIDNLLSYKKEWVKKRRDVSQPKTVKQALEDEKMAKAWTDHNAIFKFLGKYGYLTVIKELGDILSDNEDPLTSKDINIIKKILNLDDKVL